MIFCKLISVSLLASHPYNFENVYVGQTAQLTTPSNKNIFFYGIEQNKLFWVEKSSKLNKKENIILYKMKRSYCFIIFFVDLWNIIS